MSNVVKNEILNIDGITRVLEAQDSRAEAYVIDRREGRRHHPDLIVFPESTAATGDLVQYCLGKGIGIVPQGGNTGLVGGSLCEPGQVLVSTQRLNRIRNISPLDNSMIVESGCILADIQQAANQAGRFFPVSLGAEGSCTIGGNISTNAGGINVLRYGNTRQSVLGLEAVLPDGRIFNGLKSLHKDNTGYDLNQLFIGAEGTLGIVTAATLRLWPQPVASRSVFCGLNHLPDCLELLNLARRLSGDQVSSFELIPRIAMEAASRHIPGCESPLDTQFDWHVISQFASASDVINIDDIAGRFLELAWQQRWIMDAALASSGQQEAHFWKIREGIVPAQKLEGDSAKHDIAVPVSRIPELVDSACRAVHKVMPGIRPYPFGHVGDGNLHFNLLQPVAMNVEEFKRRKPELHDAVYPVVKQLGGSISAEHGIGLFKKSALARYGDAVDLDMQRRVRASFDPSEILQRGKLF